MWECLTGVVSSAVLPARWDLEKWVLRGERWRNEFWQVFVTRRWLWLLLPVEHGRFGWPKALDACTYLSLLSPSVLSFSDTLHLADRAAPQQFAATNCNWGRSNWDLLHASRRHFYCAMPLQTGMEMNNWRPWRRSPSESCQVFCLLRLSRICNFVPLRVPSRHWEPHLVSGLSEQLEQETLCSECWINGVGLLQERVKSFQTLVHVMLPALLIKRFLPLLMFGSYDSVGLLIK